MDISLLLFIAGTIFIFLGSNLLIDNSKLIAETLGISPIIIGLTIIAFGTSLPELIVSVMASFKNQGDIVIGNVIGSNISNIALVLPLIAIIKPIHIIDLSIKENMKYLYLSSIIFILLLFFNILTFYSGLFLLLIFIVFIKDQISKIYNITSDSVLIRNFHYKYIFYIGIGILMLGYGSELFINGAIGIATYLGLPMIVISLSLVALGTSLPELVTSIVAINKNEPDFVIGNILGSNIINIVLVLGSSIIIKPIDIQFNELKISVLILILTLLIFSFILVRKKSFRKPNALLLLLIYLIFIYCNFMY